MPRHKIGEKYWIEIDSPHDCENYCKHYNEPLDHEEGEPETVCGHCVKHNNFELKEAE